MKKILLSLCVMLLASMGNALAEGENDNNTWTIYAVVTEDGDGTTNRTITFKATDGSDSVKFNNKLTNQELGTFELIPDDYVFNIVSAYLSDNSESLIKKAVIDESVKNARPTSTVSMFSKLYGLTTIEGLENLNTSEVTDMSAMCWLCRNLTSLVLNFDTKNVTSMRSMFNGCTKLTSLKLNFDTRNVTDMSQMFYQCYKLADLDVSAFNTESVTNMAEMFYYCQSLTSLDLKNFDTSNVTDMKYMFYDCSKLKSLDISKFNTANVTNMSCMFCGCRSLADLNFSKDLFLTPKVTNMICMFKSCNSLKSLDLSGFDTQSVTSMYEMFMDCRLLSSLNLGTWNIRNVTTMGEMFRYCSSLKELKSHFVNAEKVTNMQYMFLNCRKLPAVDMDCNTKSVKTMEGMFSSCSSLKDFKWDRFNTTSVTNMSSMFNNCDSLKNLSFPPYFNTGNVVYMTGMFAYSDSLRTVDVSKFNTSKVKYMNSMFRDCKNLRSIDVSSFNTSSVTSMAYMFAGCSRLKTLDISNFDIKNVTTATRFAGDARSMQVINLGKNDFSKISNHEDAFYGVGFTTVNDLNKQGNYYKYSPRHLICDFDITSFGEAITDYSINKDVSNQQFPNSGSQYSTEIAPVRMYCDGAFTIADTLDCGDNTTYTPVAGTHQKDLWQYDRHMKAGQWNTMFVPVRTTVANVKKANSDYISEVCKMASYDGTTLKFTTMNDDDVIEANTAVLVWPTIELTCLAYTTVTTEVPNAEDSLAVSTDPVDGYYAKFYGCYEYGKKLDRSCYYYKYSSGQFVRSHGNSYCDNTRGYFRFFKDGNVETNGAKLFALDDDGITTSITSIDGEPVGQGSDKAYNLSGQRVGNDYKGIVIVGGKKLIRK